MSSEPPSYHSHNFYNQQSNQSKQRKPQYHGPVTNSFPTQNIYRITKKYNYPTGYKYTKFPNQVYYVQNLQHVSNNYRPILHKSLRTNNVQDDIVFINRSSFSNEMYFAEQERLLKNKHLDEMLKLESLKIYSQLINL